MDPVGAPIPRAIGACFDTLECQVQRILLALRAAHRRTGGKQRVPHPPGGTIADRQRAIVRRDGDPIREQASVHQLAQDATALGEVTGVIHAAGVSPSQAPPATIFAVDLYGTALVLEEFGNVIARGGSGVVISSQSGHRLGALTAEQDAALATTPADRLLAHPALGLDNVKDSLHAYQLSKRGNSLRVKAEAVRWGKRGARVNTISPGIIFTPLARDELAGPRGEGYRRMIERCPAGRGGTPDEVGTVGALLMGPDGSFITGSDILMDGGVTASYFYGELAPT